MNIVPRYIVIMAILLVSMPFLVSAQELTPSQKLALEHELAQVEAEQKQVEIELVKTQAQSSSLQRDVSLLNQKIKAAQLNIRAKNLKIESLGKDIKQKENHITNLEKRIKKGKETLSVILRKTNETTSVTLPEMLLAQTNLSSALQDLDEFESIQIGLKNTFEQIRSDKVETATEKNTLDNRRNIEKDAAYVIGQEKKNIESDEKEKKRLLSISKSSEKSYQTDLAAKRARAVQIRATLFPLRGSDPIPFGDAYRYAVAASQITGVRPAFVLAVIQQESNLGANVGTCNRKNDPAEKHWSKIMPGPADQAAGLSRRDDQTVFKRIVNALGVSPEGLPLSCPWGAGWGGAMGPAQFIPTTWAIFEKRISTALGNIHPDPWNPQHAFTASALYLSDLGADSQTYTTERNAACRYYSGRSCDSKSPANTFYGNEVVIRADKIQRTMINPLLGL